MSRTISAEPTRSWTELGQKPNRLLRLQQPVHLASPGGPGTRGLDGVGVDQTRDLRFTGSLVEREGSCLDLPVRLCVVGALEQIALPGWHEEGLDELAGRGRILEDAPTRPAEAPAHDAQLGHGGQEVVDIFPIDAVLDEGQDWAVVRVDVVADGERRTPDELQRRTVHDRQAEPGDQEDRSEEHTSELQSLRHLVCRLLLE